MTDEQYGTIRDGMKAFAGKTITLRFVGRDADVDEFVGKLGGALQQSGITVNPERVGWTDAPPGISFSYTKPDEGFIVGLVKSLYSAQLIERPANAVELTTSESPVIVISPKR